MKVRCIRNTPTNEELQRLGFDQRIEHRFYVTPHQVYPVLGMTFLTESSALGAGVTLEIIDDFDRWALAPLILFEIIDPRPSRYWLARRLGNGDLALWPESFSRDYYHDDLTDGVPEVVADFRRVRALLEAEFSDAPAPGTEAT